MTQSPAPSNLAITGASGVGKSLLLGALARELRPKLRLRGILSPSIVERGERVGWRLENLQGEGGLFIHRAIDSPHRFGPYGVDFDLLERLVAQEMVEVDAAPDLYIIDEIGPVGARSPGFVAAVTRVLDSPIPLICTVHRKEAGFPRAVRERPDVELWMLTAANRDEMSDEILNWGGWHGPTDPPIPPRTYN